MVASKVLIFLPASTAYVTDDCKIPKRLYENELDTNISRHAENEVKFLVRTSSRLAALVYYPALVAVNMEAS